jgi:putative endonuclease
MLAIAFSGFLKKEVDSHTVLEVYDISSYTKSRALRIIDIARSRDFEVYTRMLSFMVYMLRCADGTLYTGSTQDLVHRLECHQKGRGSKYVFSRRPFSLVYQEAQPTRGDALRREYAIKKMTRKAKWMLIQKNIRSRPRRRIITDS